MRRKDPAEEFIGPGDPRAVAEAVAGHDPTEADTQSYRNDSSSVLERTKPGAIVVGSWL